MYPIQKKNTLFNGTKQKLSSHYSGETDKIQDETCGKGFGKKLSPKSAKKRRLKVLKRDVNRQVEDLVQRFETHPSYTMTVRSDVMPSEVLESIVHLAVSNAKRRGIDYPCGFEVLGCDRANQKAYLPTLLGIADQGGEA